MDIYIKDTKQNATLSLIDPGSGIDYVEDFVGNTGALINGEFTYNDFNTYVCDQKTFDWWSYIIDITQSLDDRIDDLCDEYGSDTVNAVIESAEEYLEIDDQAASINKSLDDAFGE
jgi:hypothetical protein